MAGRADTLAAAGPPAGCAPQLVDVDERHTDEDNPCDGSGFAPRVCTDVCCLLLLLLAAAGMGALSVHALRAGDTRRLWHGFDYRGRLCGVDPGVQGRPLVYWCRAGPANHSGGAPAALDLQSPVCVAECPSDSFTGVACLGEEKVAVSVHGAQPLETVRATVSRSGVSQASYPSSRFLDLYCLPHANRGIIPEESPLSAALLAPDGPIGNPRARAAQAVRDVSAHWPIVAMSTALAVLLGYAYLWALRMAPQATITAALVAVPLVCLAAGVYLLAGGGGGAGREAWRRPGVAQGDIGSYWAAAGTRWTGLLFAALGTTLLCMAFSACSASRVGGVHLAARRAAAALDFASGMPLALLHPAADLACRLGIAVAACWTAALLLSTAEAQDDIVRVRGFQVGGLTRTPQLTYMQCMQLGTYLVCAAWLLELVGTLSHFAVSYAALLWYYTPLPKDSRAESRPCSSPLARGALVAAAFHGGTLAMGAAAAPVCRLLRCVALLLAQQAQAAHEAGNPVCCAANGCLLRCAAAVRSCVEGLGSCAYAEVCFSSIGFCEAAQTFGRLLRSDGEDVAGLLGCPLAAAGLPALPLCAAAAAYALATAGPFASSVAPASAVQRGQREAALSLVIASGCAGALVAAAFATLLGHLADVLLYAFVWNRAHGHNTVKRYAPNSLLALTGYQPLEKVLGGWVIRVPDGVQALPTASDGVRPLRRHPDDAGGGFLGVFAQLAVRKSRPQAPNSYSYEALRARPPPPE